MINFIFLKTFELCLKCIHDQQTLLFIKEIFVEIILYELSRLLERRYTLRSEKKKDWIQQQLICDWCLITLGIGL